MQMLSTFKHASAEALEAVAEEMRVRQTKSLILLFSMGSQFDHLIFQQLAKLGVFCLVADPASVSADDVKKLKPTGIIISGGPASEHNEPPPYDRAIFDLGIPTLGICLGAQMAAKHIGARVVPGEKREFGVHRLRIMKDDALFANVPRESFVLQSHGDIIEPSGGITVLASTDNAPVAAFSYKHIRGVQFHPEVTDTEYGVQLFENFCFTICGITDPFPVGKVAEHKIAALREKIAGKKVLIALSGGSDSSVVAHLLKAAAEHNDVKIRGVYIRGIDRPDDENNVHRFFGAEKWLDVKIVDATDLFLEALAGKSTMHEKRVAMRSIYRDVLEKEVEDFGADFIAQGTLYTDLVESGHGHETGARRAQIKLHHNVHNKFSVPELTPLGDCVKDNARDIGREVGVPEELLVRHPFPGPGLVVRIEGEVTAEPRTSSLWKSCGSGMCIRPSGKRALSSSIQNAPAPKATTRPKDGSSRCGPSGA
ncbi:MAG: GMP synthase (glutamine-hydrolyzing) [Patescibacteria group bacterium]